MNNFDKDYLEKLRNHAAETCTFFSNSSRLERERSVVRAFLRTLGISFEESELIAPCTEPVDVKFRTARFQNREYLIHKPNNDWKQKEKKYKNATLDEEDEEDEDSLAKVLIEPYLPPTPISLAELIPEISNGLSKKAREYPKKYPPNGCRDIDALVYINLKDRYLKVDSQPLDIKALKSQGWRSVSILFLPYGIVLTAETDAPDFLRSIEGLLQNSWKNPTTIF